MGRAEGRRANRPAAVLVGLISVTLLAASACSSGSKATPLTTIFVQKFRYHGMPTTLSPGIHELVFGVPYYWIVNAAFCHAHPLGSRCWHSQSASGN